MASTCCGSLAGSCIATSLCKACSCWCVASTRTASTVYIAFVSIFVVMALLLRYDGGDIIIGGHSNSTAGTLMDKAMHMALQEGGQRYWNSNFWCKAKHDGGWIICCADKCGGVYAVYRFSFALVMFFGMMALLTVGTTKFGARMHRCFWFGKVFVLLALLTCTLFIDNDFLQGYRELARYLSFLFLLMQILLLIEFGYSWNEKWLDYDEKNECEGTCCGWKTAILVSAGGMYVASIVLWVVMYVFFGKEGCGAQLTLITVTIIITVILTVISCTKLAPHGTLLTSAVITCYTSYLCYSALASNPDKHCNPLAMGSMESSFDQTIGLLVAGISIAVTANSATGSKQAIVGSAQGSELTTTLEDGTTKESSSEGPDDSARIKFGAESWWYYHVMMIACSLYMSMLLTDWSDMPAEKNGVPAIEMLSEARQTRYGVDLGSFWVKIVSQWICLLMYGWTLLAPYCLREVRDFGVEFEF
eukprot:CAMPEP_0181202122 /NCGR_PEP_ID=MMETSP1096-20121128/18669_1 /TAXON_ID=156174 ORGANISM="Chrysochromulina ericina, Strain CCMP281" /NCGR_SAMPLE_ID=MMETSP1096 /ASSEMBLY_ACC=CAM_ASM_000453 /LENGTH=474 /DNA_ID=CAMNT_0023292605 /DNA_START=81 /DNA_END=1505 /DNA_ORIENTATION=+